MRIENNIFKNTKLWISRSGDRGLNFFSTVRIQFQNKLNFHHCCWLGSKRYLRFLFFMVPYDWRLEVWLEVGHHKYFPSRLQSGITQWKFCFTSYQLQKVVSGGYKNAKNNLTEIHDLNSIIITTHDLKHI